MDDYALGRDEGWINATEHYLAEIERLRSALEDVLPLAESYVGIVFDRQGTITPKLDRARAALAAQPAPGKEEA